MKKFNAKKVIVSGAVGMLLLGGSVVAGATIALRWQGEPDVAQVSENLDTLDDMLSDKEDAILELEAAKNGLQDKIDSLLAELGLNTPSNSDKTFQEKLDAIILESKKDKEFSDKARVILGQIETGLHLTPVDSEDVNARVKAIYDKAVAYHTELTTEISDLEEEVEDLEEEVEDLEEEVEDLEAAAVTSGTEKQKLNDELEAAKFDISNLKTKSSNVITKHGGEVNTITHTPDGTSPVTPTAPTK